MKVFERTDLHLNSKEKEKAYYCNTLLEFVKTLFVI